MFARVMVDLAADTYCVTDEELVVPGDELFDDLEEMVPGEDGPMNALAPSAEPRPAQISTSDLLVGMGDVLAGKYRIERVHQRGAHGVTAEAEHLQLGQRVAVKLLSSTNRRPAEMMSQLSGSARIAAQLRNEHIARLIDVGALDGDTPYIVSEHLAGTALSGVMRVRERLPIAEAVDYVLQTCEALAEAHVLGLIHGNLKLSNLFLTRNHDGRPMIKVLDFAISGVALAGSTIFSRADSTVASLSSLAPEQVRDARSVDARADIWALGTILYELISGVPAFSASSAPGLFAMIAADPVPPLGELQSDTPAALESVISRCLEKDRERRWANVEVFARELENFASPEGRESVPRVVALSERRPLTPRSTLPPPLPGANLSQSIVHVAASTPTASAKKKNAGLQIIEGALITFGIVGCVLGIEAFVAVRSLQGRLGSSAPVERSVVAALSPALTASTLSSPESRPPGTSELDRSTTAPSSPKALKIAAQPRVPSTNVAVARAPAARPSAAERPAANPSAGADMIAAKVTTATTGGLFDDTN